MSDSLSPVPYCPLECDDAFEQRLALQCGFTLVRHKSLSADGAVIRPRWHVTPTGITYGDQTFSTFFDDITFRALLRCMLAQSVWQQDDLLKRIGPSLTKKQQSQMLAYLAYGREQAFFEQKGTLWGRGPQLQQITNIGPTFEWAVMEYLRTGHQALVRRCVQLREMSTQGDLDVVALRDDLTMMVECKSSSSTITKQNLRLFIQRATEFCPDIALLLIDTANEDALRVRLQQMNQELCRKGQPAMLRQLQGGSIVYWIANNLYIANTSGGIRMTLRATIQLGLALKDLAHFIVHKSHPILP
jgi:hypothetical protein